MTASDPVLPKMTFPQGSVGASRPSQFRGANARFLLKLLREHSPCSRADLVRISGLSAPTVAGAVSRLERIGLAASLGGGQSSGGRPPELLRFHARHGFVAAADIGGTRLRMMLADLHGTVVGEWSTLLRKSEKSPDGVCLLIQEGLKAMCQQSRISLRRVLHVSAGAPGITNARSGLVIAAPNLSGWDQVPLREMLEARLGVPVTVENDTNLAAIGEHRLGVARGVESFIFIALGTGVGAGVFLRGELHRGVQWCAGEIGYFGVSGRRRETLRVRGVGQLERVIGGAGVEERWRRALGRRQCDPDGRLGKLRATQIFDLACAGDALALAVLKETAALLADAIADMCLLLNPELIVLGGGVGSHAGLCRATEGLVERHEFARPQLRSSSLGTQAQLFGAISLALDAAEGHLLGEIRVHS